MIELLRYGTPVQSSTIALCAIAIAVAGCDSSSGKTSGAPSTGSSGAALSSVSPSSPAGSASSAAADRKGATPAQQGPAKPLNVMLLTIDAMRADMPWNGYERPIAPNLTKLAERGAVYTNYRSTASYTAQSVPVMVTGKYVSTLYRSGYFFAGYAKSNVFISEIMQKQGIHTGGLHAHMYFERGKQLDQGFDLWEIVPGITFDAETDNNVTSDKHVDLIKEKLTPEFTGKQFFFWSHFGDPHDQYVKHDICPQEWGKSNRDRYDCEIYFVDRELGRLLSWAEQQPWWKDTALIISSDHGEAFGEHGMWKHAFQLWDVLVRVPMIVVAPGAPPHRIGAARTHIDLAPTIMDLMRLEALPQFYGKSMVPEIYGAPAEDREPVVLELNEDSHNPAVRALVKGDWKLHVYGGGAGWKYDLYNLKDDPGEHKDLDGTEPQKLAEMKQLFNDTYAKIPFIAPYGGMKLKQGGTARGPMAPAEEGADAGAGARGAQAER